MNSPAPELAAALRGVTPGRALDLACGAGRHTRWLRENGWQVTAVDREPGLPAIRADLERGEFRIQPESWDLIVCWLYWQPDLLAAIARGVRTGGMVVLAGKLTGRFATSLPQLREGFCGWRKTASGKNEVRAFLIVRRD
jgi:SAM-dependent methyltransferase